MNITHAAAREIVDALNPQESLRRELLAYIAQAEATERERDHLLSVIIEQNALIGRLQDEREHYREIALGGGSLNEANAKLAAVVREHGRHAAMALEGSGHASVPPCEQCLAAVKALAEALK